MTLQKNITQREYIIDLEKFYKQLERYVHGTFAFSEGEKIETIEELQLLVRKCVTEREIPQENSAYASTCDDKCRRKHCSMKTPCCEEIP